MVRIAKALAQFCDGVALADTVGYANPAQVKRLFKKVKAEIGDKLEGAHFHNTRGLGLANALAAYEEGVRHFDSSMGGLGGCPFAPGASGNVITEDLVFMFESMGVPTGISLERLFQAREILVKGIPRNRFTGIRRSRDCRRDSGPPRERSRGSNRNCRRRVHHHAEPAGGPERAEPGPRGWTARRGSRRRAGSIRALPGDSWRPELHGRRRPQVVRRSGSLASAGAEPDRVRALCRRCPWRHRQPAPHAESRSSPACAAPPPASA